MIRQLRVGSRRDKKIERILTGREKRVAGDAREGFDRFRKSHTQNKKAR